MKNLIIICCIALITARCRQEKKPLFKEFEFSFGGQMTTIYSLRFTLSDTVFIKEHQRVFKDTVVYYFGIISKTQKATLDSFITSIDFTRLDTLYCNNTFMSDAAEYQLYVHNDKIQKTIFVWNNSSRQLSEFSWWLYHLQENLQRHKVSSIIPFYSSEIFEKKRISLFKRMN